MVSPCIITRVSLSQLRGGHRIWRRKIANGYAVREVDVDIANRIDTLSYGWSHVDVSETGNVHRWRKSNVPL